MLSAHDIKLKTTVMALCNTGIRSSLKPERVRTWLKQFASGPEQTLALLILRDLIFRTHDQIESSLSQALRHAAMYFVQSQADRENVHWRDILAGSTGLDFSFGPPSHQYTQPGKSGEVIVRLLKHRLRIPDTKIEYPDNITVLKPHERFLMVDDGTFTGEQLSGYVTTYSSWIRDPGKVGLVVAVAHEMAIDNLNRQFPDLPLFYGEKMTKADGFADLAKTWVETGRWPHEDTSPETVYEDVVQRADFANKIKMGFGSTGVLVAYEHGVPDDSLQLLWDKSPTWTPLFDR